jgi:AcrR family transcriptional regulator
VQVTERSVASTARRAQILDATIEVIAAEGFASASFRRIAEHAGLSSTRLISYHFAGKDELMSALVEHVVTGIGEHVGARVMAEETPRRRLRAYVDGVVSYADSHREPMAALLQVAMAGAGGATTQEPSDISHLERILHDGQERGEMRDFDTQVMATTIQRAVETVPFMLQADPDLDCASYARELVELFDRATRADA